MIVIRCEWLTDVISGGGCDERNIELAEFAATTPRSDTGVVPTAIAVFGLPKSAENTDRLRNYFSINRRSGGDDIQGCYWNHAFIIIFGSNER